VRATQLFRPLAVLALVASCKSERAKERERVDVALSWVATAGAAAKGWNDNRLPVQYTERVLDEARVELLANDDDESARIVASLREAVRRRDHAATNEPMTSLVAQWSSLRERSEKLKAGE
jgi:hypothetical protein